MSLNRFGSKVKKIFVPALHRVHVHFMVEGDEYHPAVAAFRENVDQQLQNRYHLKPDWQPFQQSYPGIVVGFGFNRSRIDSDINTAMKKCRDAVHVMLVMIHTHEQHVRAPPRVTSDGQAYGNLWKLYQVLYSDSERQLLNHHYNQEAVDEVCQMLSKTGQIPPHGPPAGKVDDQHKASQPVPPPAPAQSEGPGGITASDSNPQPVPSIPWRYPTPKISQDECKRSLNSILEQTKERQLYMLSINLGGTPTFTSLLQKVLGDKIQQMENTQDWIIEAGNTIIKLKEIGESDEGVMQQVIQDNSTQQVQFVLLTARCADANWRKLAAQLKQHFDKLDTCTLVNITEVEQKRTKEHEFFEDPHIGKLVDNVADEFTLQRNMIYPMIDPDTSKPPLLAHILILMSFEKAVNSTISKVDDANSQLNPDY